MCTVNENRIPYLQHYRTSDDRIFYSLISGSIHFKSGFCSRTHTLPCRALSHLHILREPSPSPSFGHTRRVTTVGNWRILGSYKPYNYIPLKPNSMYFQLRRPLARSPKCLSDRRKTDNGLDSQKLNYLAFTHFTKTLLSLFLPVFFLLSEQFSPKASRWDRAG